MDYWSLCHLHKVMLHLYASSLSIRFLYLRSSYRLIFVEWILLKKNVDTKGLFFNDNIMVTLVYERNTSFFCGKINVSMCRSVFRYVVVWMEEIIFKTQFALPRFLHIDLEWCKLKHILYTLCIFEKSLFANLIFTSMAIVITCIYEWKLFLLCRINSQNMTIMWNNFLQTSAISCVM